MMSGSGKGSSMGSGMSTGMQERWPLAHANPPRLQPCVRSSPHSELVPSSLLDFAFLKWDLSSFCLFLLTISWEVGAEQPSGSLLSGCLFGRKQTAEGKCLKEEKKLNLGGKTPSEKMKSGRPEGKETYRESLGCASNGLWLIMRRTALLLMTGIFVFAEFWHFNTMS